jgi:hypothetical protein
VTTSHDLLGDFHPVERTDLELENSSMQVISKADRLRLTSSDKNKIYVSFSKGIPSKFKASSTIVGLDEVLTIDNIMSFDQLHQMRVQDVYGKYFLRNHVTNSRFTRRKSGMHVSHMFSVLPSGSGNIQHFHFT